MYRKTSPSGKVYEYWEEGDPTPNLDLPVLYLLLGYRSGGKVHLGVMTPEVRYYVDSKVPKEGQYHDAHTLCDCRSSIGVWGNMKPVTDAATIMDQVTCERCRKARGL